MATRRPIVHINGNLSELPAGDVVPVTGVPIYVQDTAPTPPVGTYVWWQTNYLTAGSLTLWIENGL